jgi:Txe/YoeB family toxin of Txe-Axe toxin-antitoxin module
MSKETKDFDFELDLIFYGQKNPVQAFGQIAKMYERLLSIDQQVLYNVLPSAKLEYELIDLEYSSIKSKVNQILKSIPDDILKDIANPGKLLGHLLVYIKKRLIKATETNEVQSIENLQKITSDINKEIKKLPSTTIIILEINNYFVLNAINELGIEGRKLKRDEYFEYKSKAGNARIGNSSSVNMAKLLYELGGQTLEQQRIETLKVKSLDLLSDKASWKLIRQGKQIEVKILHKEWLDDYHNRKVIIQPNDYLKVDLKITYTTNNNTLKSIVNYEALKVIEVIPPDKMESNKQNSLFDN